MKPYYENENGKLYHASFLDNIIPDKSQQLIIADPPYFEVKGHFDFTWGSFEEYLSDVNLWAIECKRILADNGTLFWWGNSKKIAYSQIILDKYFNLHNSIVWRKPDSIQYQYYSVELSRCFNTHNERLLMYTNDYEPSDWNKTGNERIHEEFIKPNNPFSIYLKSEFKKACVTRKSISKLFPSRTGNTTGCVSNWLNGDNVITEDQYLKIRDYLNGDYLRKEYEDLRKEYEDQRRYFNNSMKLEEIFTFSQDSKTSKKFKHETIKPIAICKTLIDICSRKGNNICIPFLGSGSECLAAESEGRNFTGFDIEEEYCEIAAKRIEAENRQLKLF